MPGSSAEIIHTELPMKVYHYFSFSPSQEVCSVHRSVPWLLQECLQLACPFPSDPGVKLIQKTACQDRGLRLCQHVIRNALTSCPMCIINRDEGILGCQKVCTPSRYICPHASWYFLSSLMLFLGRWYCSPYITLRKVDLIKQKYDNKTILSLSATFIQWAQCFNRAWLKIKPQYSCVRQVSSVISILQMVKHRIERLTALAMAAHWVSCTAGSENSGLTKWIAWFGSWCTNQRNGVFSFTKYMYIYIFKCLL